MKIFLILFLGAISSIALCTEIKIKFIKGRAKVNQAFLKKTSELKYGDVIKTGANSLVILQLGNYSNVKINELSSVKIQPPKQTKSGKKRRGIILKAGSVFVNAAQKALKKDGSTLVVKTKFASMGVRGTEFFVSYSTSEKEKQKKDIWMCVNEGQVVVFNRKTRTKTFVNQGEGIQVPFGKDTSKPRPLAWTKKLNWSMNPKTDVVNKIDIREAYYDLLNVDYD